MKVTTDTPELLIIDDRPLFVGIMLMVFILVFVGVGLGMVFSGESWGWLFTLLGGGMGVLAFWAFVRRVQVVFHRAEGYVEVRRRNLFGGQRKRHALGDIARAELEESRSSSGNRLWRVVLVAGQSGGAGRYPITFAYSNGRGHHRAAQAINLWLEAGPVEARRPLGQGSRNHTRPA